MKHVVIRECPVWAGTREQAARVAAALRNEPGLQVEMVDGARGELTVLVDGKEVARKQGDKPPSVEEVVAAVKKVGAPTAGAHA